MAAVLPDHRGWPALMRQAQDGDQVAYARLLRAMLPAIRAMVARRLADEGLIDDIVQDVLLAVHRVRHTYDPDRPILPWLSAIVAARAIDALRRRGRRERRECWDDARMMAEIDPDAERRMEHFATAQHLDRLLALLPGRQRDVVELVGVREMSLAEAAEVNSLTIPAIKSLLHRAFHKLRQNGPHDHG